MLAKFSSLTLAPAIIATVILPFVFDSFVFGVTIFKTYQHALEMRRHGHISIAEVLLRDGKIYQCFCHINSITYWLAPRMPILFVSLTL